jgi:hypothetical protein
MTKWEYLVVQKQPTGVWMTLGSDLTLGWGDEPQMLTKCGEDGWELVAVAVGRGPAPDYYFKKPVE